MARVNISAVIISCSIREKLGRPRRDRRDRALVARQTARFLGGDGSHKEQQFCLTAKWQNGEERAAKRARVFFPSPPPLQFALRLYRFHPHSTFPRPRCSPYLHFSCLYVFFSSLSSTSPRRDLLPHPAWSLRGISRRIPAHRGRNDLGPSRVNLRPVLGPLSNLNPEMMRAMSRWIKKPI